MGLFGSGKSCFEISLFLKFSLQSPFAHLAMSISWEHGIAPLLHPVSHCHRRQGQPMGCHRAHQLCHDMHQLHTKISLMVYACCIILSAPCNRIYDKQPDLVGGNHGHSRGWNPESRS